MHVFLSWSGTRSHGIAAVLRDWLPRVLQAVKPWMSSKDIAKGGRWYSEIGENLEKHHIGIVCITPENYHSPWLMFESGALSKTLGVSKVCPILLGLTPKELEGPISGFQATVFQKEDMLALVRSLNSELGEDKISTEIISDVFEKYWPELESKVFEVSKSVIPGTCMSVESVVKAFAKNGLPEPVVGSQTYFDSGFESHRLYHTVTDLASERLYFFGRKNRKLFDKEHKVFFQRLAKKINDGLDFKVLFLNACAPGHVLDAAHTDADFCEQLDTCQRRASTVLEEFGINPRRHCRMYDTQRTMATVVADDAVLYTAIRVGKEGRAKALTDCPFVVMNSTSAFGTELVSEFLECWEVSTPLPVGLAAS